MMKKAATIASFLLFASLIPAMAAEETPAKNATDNIADSAIEDDTPQVNDPIEPVNRAVFKFNMFADKWVLRPVAVGYKYAVPAWGRQRVTNVFSNISEPVTFVNSTLQADPKNSFTSLWRFIINTTAGVGGVFDPATEIGLIETHEDFGQTLGRWGYTNPPYIVIPLLGPSTLRDGFGLVVDYYTNPFYNGIVTDDEAVKISMAVVNGVDKRANILTLTDDIEKTSLDPYITYRSYYMQNRENSINNGQQDKGSMSINPAN